jgi:hypothetical protein
VSVQPAFLPVLSAHLALQLVLFKLPLVLRASDRGPPPWWASSRQLTTNDVVGRRRAHRTSRDGAEGDVLGDHRVAPPCAPQGPRPDDPLRDRPLIPWTQSRDPYHSRDRRLSPKVTGRGKGH